MPAPGPHPALPTAAQLGETQPGRGNRPWHWLSARPWPVHPILLAACFVLFLYSVNDESFSLSHPEPLTFPER